VLPQFTVVKVPETSIAPGLPTATVNKPKAVVVTNLVSVYSILPQQNLHVFSIVI